MHQMNAAKHDPVPHIDKFVIISEGALFPRRKREEAS